MSYEWTHAPHIHEYNGKRVYAFIDVNPLETNSYLVRKEGLEPTRPFGHQILNLARLPVPPLSHVTTQKLQCSPTLGKKHRLNHCRQSRSAGSDIALTPDSLKHPLLVFFVS